VNFLGIYLRPENETSLHNDRETKKETNADLVLILPIHPQEKQTLFFDNNQIFKECPIHKNFYSVKDAKKDVFLNDLSNEQHNIPNDAIASLFYINNKNGDAVIHCGPFDTTNKSITDSIANLIPINTKKSDKKRCFVGWKITHKNHTKTDYF
jgi:polysaccharide deacetylase 2 family uncharacterized protein YibQ